MLKIISNGYDVLTQYTPALTCGSALRDVKIPPGPRLLILDHIQRSRLSSINKIVAASITSILSHLWINF